MQAQLTKNKDDKIQRSTLEVDDHEESNDEPQQQSSNGWKFDDSRRLVRPFGGVSSSGQGNDTFDFEKLRWVNPLSIMTKRGRFFLRGSLFIVLLI